MNIYLIRHGETDWNLIGKVQGREDIPLNNTGRKQAMSCATALKGKGIMNIISSPLIRALETASIISNETVNTQIIVDEDLIERDFGEMSGVTYDHKRYFDIFDYEESMESLENVSKRLLACIHRYAVKYSGQDIIMVSHGAAINSVIMALTKGDKGSGKTRLKNACISILTYEDNDINLGLFNLTPEEFISITKNTRDFSHERFKDIGI